MTDYRNEIFEISKSLYKKDLIRNEDTRREMGISIVNDKIEESGRTGDNT